MPTFMLDSLTGRYLSFQEQEEIAMAQGAGVREIARRLGRDPSTISRELRRNAAGPDPVHRSTGSGPPFMD
jgi:IS30 family transposase